MTKAALRGVEFLGMNCFGNGGLASFQRPWIVLELQLLVVLQNSNAQARQIRRHRKCCTPPAYGLAYQHPSQSRQRAPRPQNH
jgi:hypothetical protein